MNIAFIDNYDSFAHTIAGYLEICGASITMYKSSCDLRQIKKSKPNMIVLGPGPNSPVEAGNYLSAIDYFHARIPIFGVCLGFQAMMHYFGRPVHVLKEAVHGAVSPIDHTASQIFAGIKSPQEFARYHSLGLYVDEVPECFTTIATCPDENGRIISMAAVHKTLPIAGVQFHPESILSARFDQGMRLMKNTLEFLAQ